MHRNNILVNIINTSKSDLNNKNTDFNFFISYHIYYF